MIQILPGYVKTASPVSQSTTTWRGITRIECHAEALYLLISEHAAIIIPKRAFPEDTLFEQFSKVAVEFHSRAQQ